MRKITITLSENEYSFLKKYAKANKTPMSKVLKSTFFTTFENEYGLNVFDDENDQESYSVEEVIDDLGLNIK